MTYLHEKMNSNASNTRTNDKTLRDAAAALTSQDDDLKKETILNLENNDFHHQRDNGASNGGRDMQHHQRQEPAPYRFVPLKMDGRTHTVSKESKLLIEEEVTLNDLEQMTTLFYENAFLDGTLDQFIRSHGDPHAARFAKWIHQKLSGSSVWDRDRATRKHEPVHDRSSAHVAAWYSPKRPSSDLGRHFKLDECRVWMRLHFWALRESRMIEKSPSFVDYYIRFIAHFVRVYESTAPAFARDSYRWSANPKNIQSYIENGRKMTDVLGLSLRKALKQIPEHEANDDIYPYHQKQQP